MFAQHAVSAHADDKPAFIGFDMDVAHALAHRFGDNRVDQADCGGIVGAVEQILGAGNAEVEVAAVERPRHRRRRAVNGIMVGQEAVEIGGVRGRHAQRLRQIALHFDQHGRIAAFAQRGKPDAILAGRDDHAVRTRKAVRNIDRRRGRRGRFDVAHGYSPVGGAGACETDGGMSVGVILPPSPRNSGRLTGPTVTSAALGSLGAGGTVPR